MLSAIFGHIADHWMLSTYISVMTVNESAILAAFSLVSKPEFPRIIGLTFVSAAGALTNDIILYLIARYGSERFFKSANQEEKGSESFFERVFLGNTFLALLCIKFLFGVRLFLTVYLVAKKKIPFVRFVAYDLCGIIVYVVVIGSIGLLVGHGNLSVASIYELIFRVVSIVCICMLITHLIARILRRQSS